jgi:hypothetical protein
MTLVEDVDGQVFILRLPDNTTDISSSTRLFRWQTTIGGLSQRHGDMHRLVEDRYVVGEAQNDKLTARRK